MDTNAIAEVVEALVAQLRGSGPGPACHLPNRDANQVTPYFVSKAPDTTWQHDMFTD